MTTRPTDVRDPNYVVKLNLYVNQLHQDDVNKQVHDAWVAKATDWQARNQHNKELQLPVESPLVLPTMTIWHDDGTVDHPLFPDLKLPVLVDATPTTGTGGFRPPDLALPPDRIDGIVLALGLVLHDLDAMKLALGVS